jgi:hypothetical protein
MATGMTEDNDSDAERQAVKNKQPPGALTYTTENSSSHPMQWSLRPVTLLAGLITPLLAGADEQEWRASDWHPIPPVQPSVELGQLAQLLAVMGVITDYEDAQLLQSRLPGPARQTPVKVWT